MTSADIIRIKDLLPTAMGSDELREQVARDILRRSVFSARMESARYLALVRDVCAEFAAGEINRAQAMERLMAELARMGHSPIDGGGLTNPASIKRLDLIVLQLLSFVARNRLASAIEALGFYDDFGYKNRRAFFRQVENLYVQNKLNGNYSALMMNMRHFSIINQDIGRSNGDVVLRNFYKLLSAIADTDGIVSRLGGDSFIALLRNELVEHITSILQKSLRCR